MLHPSRFKYCKKYKLEIEMQKRNIENGIIYGRKVQLGEWSNLAGQILVIHLEPHGSVR